MSGHETDANKEVVRRIEEAWNANDMGALDELIAADFVAHTPGAEQLPPGLEGAKAAHAGVPGGFPDRNVAIEDMVAEGDRVYVRCRMTGSNSGTGLPWFGLEANGKAVDVEWITEYRLEGGRVVETWAQMDLAKMMQ